MTNYLPEFGLCDSTADVLIEKGKYWDDKTTFLAYKITSGYDPNHYMSFDVNRGPEASGWTLFSSPGTFAVKAGKKTPQDSNGIFLVAEGGNVAITAMNGDIRLKARNIHIDASLNLRNTTEGVVNIKGEQKVSVHAPTIEVEAKKLLRVVSSGNFSLDVKNVTELFSGMSKASCNSSSVGTNLASFGATLNHLIG